MSFLSLSASNSCGLKRCFHVVYPSNPILLNLIQSQEGILSNLWAEDHGHSDLWSFYLPWLNTHQIVHIHLFPYIYQPTNWPICSLHTLWVSVVSFHPHHLFWNGQRSVFNKHTVEGGGLTTLNTGVHHVQPLSCTEHMKTCGAHWNVMGVCW